MGDIPVYIRALPNPSLTHHRPQHVYESSPRCPVHSELGVRDVICQLTTNTRETTIWCEDDCRAHLEWTQLKKAYASMGTSFATVWQDTGQVNLTTGRVESDPKKFARHLREQSEVMGERLGMNVDYQPADMTDRDALGVTEEGMDATHDAAVRDGRKDSRGRFVF